ncbi:hypothetical protein D3C87_1342530 [compost metagenome]
MFKFSMMTVAMLVTLTNSAFAATSEEVVGESVANRVEVRERSSEHYRMNKDFELTFSPISFGGFALTNSGVTAGAFINRNSQVLANYSWNASDRTCIGAINCDLEDKFASVAFKRFVSNTFYMQGGASHHTISYTESNSNGDIEFGYDATITTADFAIGNQWNFNGFTLGCDWVSFGLPVATTYKNSFYTEDGTLSELNDRQDEWKKNGKIFFTKLYLGATF